MPAVHTYYARGPVDLAALRRTGATRLDIRGQGDWTRVDYNGQASVDEGLVATLSREDHDVLVAFGHTGSDVLEFAHYAGGKRAGELSLIDGELSVVGDVAYEGDSSAASAAEVLAHLESAYHLPGPGSAPVTIRAQGAWLRVAALALLAIGFFTVALRGGRNGSEILLGTGLIALCAAWVLLLRRESTLVRIGGALVGTAIAAPFAGIVGSLVGK